MFCRLSEHTPPIRPQIKPAELCDARIDLENGNLNRRIGGRQRRRDARKVLRPGAAGQKVTTATTHIDRVNAAPLDDLLDGHAGSELTVEFTVLGRRFLDLNGGRNFTPNESDASQREEIGDV